MNIPQPIKLNDLSLQQDKIRSDIDLAIKKVLDHGQYIMGPEVVELENELKLFSRSEYVYSCANGTDALKIALMAFGVGPGDAVFLPSFTFVATAEAPALLGAIPFFVDVLEDTFNIDPLSFQQGIIDAKKLNLNPAVVIPVDLFGLPADIDSLSEIAKKEGIKILVDSAQSFGGESKGRVSGSMGDATTTSFFPAKPLGCYGDGGAVFTNNETLASEIDRIRVHGKGFDKYDNVRIGLNSRLDTIQAAILIEKLKILPDEIINRQAIAKLYTDNLENFIKCPTIPEDYSSAWAQYTLQSENRDEIVRRLKEKDIGTAIYYPKPLHNQTGYTGFPVVSTGLDVSSSLSRKVFSLPMHPYIPIEQIERVIYELKSIIKDI
tara:strand:+ start:1600 stop:2736 length:1137 start_codon:yes stop_codon:yes gene_type:complete